MCFLLWNGQVYNTLEISVSALSQSVPGLGYVEDSMKLATGLFIIVSFTSSLGNDLYLTNRPTAASQGCPTDLSKLRPQMEAALVFVSSNEFKKAILTSLSASIPDAIQQADGINAQIAFLLREIAEQDRLRKYSEDAAREAKGNFMEPLRPCRPHEAGSYCNAVEQYYISSASNLANRAFLAALQCYKRQGMR